MDREKIREIWRPLYDMGVKGQEQVDGQYMAYLISAAVDETQAQIEAYTNQKVLEELKYLKSFAPTNYEEFLIVINSRIKELKSKVEQEKHED